MRVSFSANIAGRLEEVSLEDMGKRPIQPDTGKGDPEFYAVGSDALFTQIKIGAHRDVSMTSLKLAAMSKDASYFRMAEDCAVLEGLASVVGTSIEEREALVQEFWGKVL